MTPDSPPPFEVYDVTVIIDDSLSEAQSRCLKESLTDPEFGFLISRIPLAAARHRIVGILCAGSYCYSGDDRTKVWARFDGKLQEITYNGYAHIFGNETTLQNASCVSPHTLVHELLHSAGYSHETREQIDFGMDNEFPNWFYARDYLTELYPDSGEAP